MNMNLQDAGVVITGGGGGIGAAMARKFASAGARIVLADIAPGPVEKLAAELGATAVVGDAASEDGVASLIARARATLGTIDMFCATRVLRISAAPNSTTTSGTAPGT
jgi:NAD(P)-dependent dehydrogenase (short-subunit alcohol dehydrogenase family)